MSIINRARLYTVDGMEYVAKNKAPQSWLKHFQKPGKQMFWAWIAYQTVKGTLTTSLIWIPLIWAWVY